MPIVGSKLALLSLAAVLLLAGCQTYSPAPLPDAPDFVAVPAQPLGLAAVAQLAVQNSPDLVASRAKAQVAHAQAYAAGLLPDPQFTASADHPSDSTYVNGYALGLAEDLQQLLTYPSRHSGANAVADQARLDLLWDEWQTIEKAGTLAAQKYYDDQKAQRLADSASVLNTQSAQTTKALDEGNTTMDQAGGDLAAALDTASQKTQAQRDALTADSELKQLLNAAPDATLALADPGLPDAVSKDDVTKALANIAKVRPDLLALSAGYQAQEEVVRQSILEQFPAITLGGTRAADTSNVHTVGLSLQVNLPIFGGAQANISIQHATRDQLRAEYQARLNQTTTDAWRLWQEIQFLREDTDKLDAQLPQFRRMAEAGQAAHAAGDLPPATYVVLQTTLASRESEADDLKSALWADTLALRTLLGLPFAAVPAEKTNDLE